MPLADLSLPEPNRDAFRASVFVTLADGRYVEQAKQVFSSVYFNGGWCGDYLLLAYQIDEAELTWFERRGILVWRCPSLFEGKPGGMPPVLASKFFLFTPEFRRWRSIIYCDADATVRASLDGLCSLNGFWSIEDASRWLSRQVVTRQSMLERGIGLHHRRHLVKELRRKIDLLAPPFCAGFFVFSTDLIDDQIFDGLKATMDRYHVVSEYGDQLSFNVFFHEKWHTLPPVYNVQVCDEENRWRLEPHEVDGIVLHYISAKKPWITKNRFYDEWRLNLARADQIDLSKIPAGQRWDDQKIADYSTFLDSRKDSKSFGPWVAILRRRGYHRLAFALGYAQIQLHPEMMLWRLGKLTRYLSPALYDGLKSVETRIKGWLFPAREERPPA
jgi:lipopolysaccharide biosynthesis glycosyltransferase